MRGIHLLVHLLGMRWLLVLVLELRALELLLMQVPLPNV